MASGFWFLAMVLRIGTHEALVQPFAVYTMQQVCTQRRDALQPLSRLPLTCYRAGAA